MELQSAHLTVTHLDPAGEADEVLPDLNFGDSPSAGAPAADQGESQ